MVKKSKRYITKSFFKVNNAGTNHQQLDFAEISSELWEPLVEVNIKAGLYMIRWNSSALVVMDHDSWWCVMVCYVVV